MKKFITIALAVAVLFSFAACQPTSYDGQVVRLGATINEGAYLVGETVTVDDFTFVGYTNIGAEVSVSSSDVTITSGEHKVVADDNTVAFSYNKSTATGTATFKGVKATSVTVDAEQFGTIYELPSAQEANVIDGPDTTAKIEYEAVAEYEGGSKTVVMTTDLATLLSGTVKTSLGGKEITTTITPVEARIESVTLEKTEKYDAAYYAEDKNATNAAISYSSFAGEPKALSDGIYAVAHYQGGYDVYLASSAVTLRVGNANITAGSELSTVVDANASSVTVSASYTGTGNKVIPGFSDVAGSQTITLVKNVLDSESVTITCASGITAADYTTTLLSPNPFTISGKLVDGKTTATFGNLTFRNNSNASTVADDYYTISQLDLSDYKAGQSVELTVSGSLKGVTFSDTLIVDLK